jgi:hypothetical protein
MNDLTPLTPEERETINEDFPWALDYIDELNAEIERLKGLVIERDTWARPEEIERLRKGFPETYRENVILRELIAELADAANGYLDNDGSRGTFWVVDLGKYRKALETALQRTREASR